MRWCAILCLIGISFTGCDNDDLSSYLDNPLVSEYDNFGDWYDNSNLYFNFSYFAESDTINYCYLLKEEGNIYIVPWGGLLFECIRKIPLFPLEGNRTIYFDDEECSHSPGFNVVLITTIASKRSIGTDTIYLIRQELGGGHLTIKEVDDYPKKFRFFEFSFKEGVVSMRDSTFGDASHLHWPY